MDQLTLGKLLMKIGELPSLPYITNRVLELTDDPEASSNEICEVICQDHVLASKVLKLVNSAYYGLPRKVGTIPEAVTILGMRMLRALVIGTSVFKTLSGLRGKWAVKPEKIWRHALACAVSSKMIASHLGIAGMENAFTAGLLHDIGKIIFNSFLQEDYLKVMELSSNTGCSVAEAEKEILNTTHAEVGKVVAEKWNLPATLHEPIGYHHDPFCECENRELVMVVHLADIAAMLAGYSTSDNANFLIDPNVFKKSGTTYDQVFRVASEIKGKISLELI